MWCPMDVLRPQGCSAQEAHPVHLTTRMWRRTIAECRKDQHTTQPIGFLYATMACNTLTDV